MGWLLLVIRNGEWVFTGTTYATRDAAEAAGVEMGMFRCVRHDPRFGSPKDGTPLGDTGYSANLGRWVD